MDNGHASLWVVHSLSDFLLNMKSQPREYPSYTPGSNRAHAFWGEVDKMLERAMETVYAQVPALYSRLFLVEKATDDWRPVIDLLPLNKYINLSSSGWRQYPRSSLQW